MSMKRTVVIILLLFMVGLIQSHPFYVSVTEIDLKENSLQVSMKIFIDDLESTLEKQGKPKLNLGEENENEYSQEYIKQYLLPRFYVKVNDELASYKYVGQEVEEDAIWIYLEIKNVTKVKSLEVMNSIITEKYEGQSNLVHTNINGEKKSMVLNKMKHTDKLEF